MHVFNKLAVNLIFCYQSLSGTVEDVFSNADTSLITILLFDPGLSLVFNACIVDQT